MIDIMLIFSFVLIGIVNLVLLFSLISSDNITGFFSQSSTGSVYVRIVRPIDIIIHSPINNWTYSFNVDDGVEFEHHLYYPIELLVSADEEVVDWKYSIYNNNILIEEDVPLDPNSTIFFRQGINKIVVSATNDPGVWFNEESEFEITVGESVPVLEAETDYYLCEGSFFRREISAIDYDQNIVDFGIQPETPIYVETLYNKQDGIFYYGAISTSLITKMMVDTTLQRLLYVYDEDEFHASLSTYFHILEVNRVPEYNRLGVYKLWKSGKDSVFNKTWYVYDIEDGFLEDGLMEINISYQNGSEFDLFELNPNGSMYYEATNESIAMAHNLSLCIKDNPIEDVHPNLTEHCGSDGSSNIVCEDMYLTISDENRPVEILDIFPSDNFNVDAFNDTEFWVLIEDFDGDILEYSFYHNDDELYYNVTNNYDDDYRYLVNFTHFFGCGIDGEQNLTFNVSDGLNFDNFSWVVDVNGVPCEEEVPTYQGGGGPVPFYCVENWGCDSWSTCQNVESSYKLGSLSIDDYYSYKDKCSQLGFSDGSCGFQLRECIDLNQCNNSEYKRVKPEIDQICHFTKNPNCFDKIKNCHDGSCETGVDCGGPCKPCPTCSDNIQNQGEEGVDCGGPCPIDCEKEMPLMRSIFIISLLLLLLILIIFIIQRIVKIIKGQTLTREDKRSQRIKNLLNKN